MANPSAGRFWAIGVGPGDPGLMTLKAVEHIREADVIYHAGPVERQGRAWDIVRKHVRPEQIVRIVLTQSMTAVTAGDWRVSYRAGVDQIAADCRGGKNVAFVTEGDPTLYSTAACVWKLLAERHPEIPIEIVPGVSSITAAAARVGWPLARRDEMLAVVPASYHQAELAKIVGQFPNVCLLKAARAISPIHRALEQTGREYDAVYVENLGTAKEFITHDLTNAAVAQREDYFSLVLLKMKDAVPSPVSTPSNQEGTASKLWVVGLGPGDPALLTGQALEILREADVVIGYDEYLKKLASLGLRAELRGSPIGAEKERASLALDLAQAGRRVALVSSGDAGVYGMASLLLESAGMIAGLEVEIVPGVTAATSAAALLGAPLGHDFACISLSDLLTPWETIERRLKAAGESDFVVVLYNPISKRRIWQLPKTREILLQHRRPDTVIGLVDKAYRPGTKIWSTTLGELSGEGVGMETIVIIGNSRTRLINDRMVTPRGYGDRP